MEGNFWFGMKEAFKEGKGIQGEKRHSKREEAFKEGKGILGGEMHSGRENFGWDKQGNLGGKFLAWWALAYLLGLKRHLRREILG